MIYIYNAISILAVGLLFKKQLYNDKKKKKFLMFAFMQMFIIQALRSPDVGTDTMHYVNVYKNFQNSEYYEFLFTHFEPGFKWLYLILKHFNCTQQWLLVVVSAITMYGFAYFIYKNTKNPWISTFIFACMFYPNSFNIMRQYMAISIAINSFPYVIDKKYIKGSILILIGTLFHSTAFLMFIPMLFRIIKNWKIIRNLIIASTVIFFAFGTRIVSLLLPFLGKEFYLTGFEVSRIFRMTTVLTFVFAILIWYFAKTMKDERYKTLLNLLSCVAFVNMDFGILYLKYEFFSRVIEILNLYLLIGVPYGLIYSNKKYRQLITLGVCVISLFLLIIFVYNSEAGISEYKLFF